jgi:hypothetical protein
MEKFSTVDKKNDRTISFKQANYFGLIIAVPIVLIAALVYFKFWNESFIALYNRETSSNWLLFLGILLVLIFFHELIHGITWRILCKSNHKKIKFGFHKKTLTPYTHINMPMELSRYRLGSIMPFLILGLIPLVFSVV